MPSGSSSWTTLNAEEPQDCISALVLQGLKKPVDCPAFGTRCTPMNPLGAPMVSTEGACAAYYQYRRHACMLTSTETAIVHLSTPHRARANRSCSDTAAADG